MGDNADYRPLVCVLLFMILCGPSIKLWFDMADEKSKFGKWALGILAGVHTAGAVTTLTSFFLIASGVWK